MRKINKNIHEPGESYVNIFHAFWEAGNQFWLLGRTPLVLTSYPTSRIWTSYFDSPRNCIPTFKVQSALCPWSSSVESLAPGLASIFREKRWLKAREDRSGVYWGGSLLHTLLYSFGSRHVSPNWPDKMRPWKSLISKLQVVNPFKKAWWQSIVGIA